MHGLTPMNLPLACAKTSEERFQFIVGAVAFRPSIAREQTRPSLPKGGRDMRHHRGVGGMVSGLLFQLRQEGFDLALDLATRGVRLPFTLGRVKQPIQLHQPVPLAVESPIRRRKGLAPLHHGQQLNQQRMPPFWRLRSSEVAKRVKSSNTRRPPRAKGGLLPSVSVARINSA